MPARPVRRRPDPRHVLGRSGEDAAAAHFERLGYDLLVRNHRTRWCELDLIACDARHLVFVEVKSRRAGGSPLEALTPEKAMRVRRGAAAWLATERERPRGRELRFDAVAVTFDATGALERLEHLEGAF